MNLFTTKYFLLIFFVKYYQAENASNHFVIANLVDKNMTLKLKHLLSKDELFLNENSYYWNLIDPLTDKNFRFNYSNNIHEHLRFKFLNDTKNSSFKYSFNFNQFSENDGGKILKYIKTSNQSDETLFSFELISIKNRPYCTSINTDTFKIDEVKNPVFEVHKNSTYNFYCSILARSLSENSNPYIYWQIENSSKIFDSQTFEFKFNLTQKIRTRKSEGYNVRYWQSIIYRVPDDDLKAWEHHNEQIFCHVRHGNFFNDHLLASKDKKFMATLPRPSKIPNLQCQISLNVQFNPFIHPNISLIQEFHEDLPALVECPIKANNHYPVKYFLIWSIYSNNSKKFQDKLIKEYIGSADIYVIENPIYEYHDGILVKCELYEIEQGHHHSIDYKKNIFLELKKEKINKKIKFLFNSTIKIQIIRKTNSTSGLILYNSNLDLTNCILISLIEALIFFTGMYFYCLLNDRKTLNIVSNENLSRISIFEKDQITQNETKSSNQLLSENITTTEIEAKESTPKKSNFRESTSFFSHSKSSLKDNTSDETDYNRESKDLPQMINH
ncbi:unnamed protein product [Brachionus calyciflorus]|uniref:Ig-like domain-containing protein n=1 Tax=Brachionus calyciflorus TaxID=104777 RepID=A0A813MQS7_9BILA|nr:unnamed protein product [Brachionus calyciflorus]